MIRVPNFSGRFVVGFSGELMVARWWPSFGGIVASLRVWRDIVSQNNTSTSSGRSGDAGIRIVTETVVFFGRVGRKDERGGARQRYQWKFAQ